MFNYNYWRFHFFDDTQMVKCINKLDVEVGNYEFPEFKTKHYIIDPQICDEDKIIDEELNQFTTMDHIHLYACKGMRIAKISLQKDVLIKFYYDNLLSRFGSLYEGDIIMFKEDHLYSANKFEITSIFEPTEEMWKSMISKKYSVFQYIENPTQEMCEFAISINSNAIAHIENPTDEMCKLAISRNPYAITHIKNQTEEMCKLAISIRPYAITHIKNPTEEICKLAISICPDAIMFIENQTEEICKLAISINPKTIQCVKNQTEEMCKLAVQQNGNVLCFVKLQTDEICKLAIRNKFWSALYVNDNYKMWNYMATQNVISRYITRKYKKITKYFK